MGTKPNLLEPLRKKYGCKLTEEQIAIKMGLEPDAQGRRAYKVNKFETGTTKNKGLINAFRYSLVTNIPIEEIFAALNPDELYSKMFLASKEKEQDMKKIDNATDVIVIGESGEGKGCPYVLSELKRELFENPEIVTEIPEFKEELESNKELKKLYEENPKQAIGRFLNDKLKIVRFDGVSTDNNTDSKDTGFIRETPWASAADNTCVIGTAGTGKNRFFMMPEILAAMNEDKNLFVILDGDEEDFDKIKEKAKETGHEVFIDKFPYTSINWFSCVNEPESIEMMVRTLVNSENDETKNDRDEKWTTVIPDVFIKLCKHYLWKDDVWSDKEKHRISSFSEYISALTLEQLSSIVGDACSECELSSVVTGILIMLQRFSVKENPKADRLEEIFRKKHVIVYQVDKLNRGDITLSLALEQYLRILFNVKEYPLKYRDKRKYEVVIDEFPNTINFDIAPSFAVARKYDLSFVYSIASIEQLRGNESDYRCLSVNTPSVYIMGFEKTAIFSAETEDFIVSSFSEQTIGTAKKNRKKNTKLIKNNLINCDELMVLPPLFDDFTDEEKKDIRTAILYIEQGKDPEVMLIVGKYNPILVTLR